MRIVQKSVERCEYGGTIDDDEFFKSGFVHAFFFFHRASLMGVKTDDIFSRIRTHRRSVYIHFASSA